LLALGLSAATPAFAGDNGSRAANDCYKCPAPKSYDSQEVVKTSKDVDHSAVIETKSVAPLRRVIETNHLIIRENETRNVGTVQHNHTIVEKELVLTKRNVDTKTVNTVVNLVEHKYNSSASASSRSASFPAPCAICATATAMARAPSAPTAWRRRSAAAPPDPRGSPPARTYATLQTAHASAAPPGHQRGGPAFGAWDFGAARPRASAPSPRGCRPRRG
jgi:hypothetical protein